mmetsp:Transcript_106828/g.340212  ORF Transcript_106828/g.340212 Transcript_106828/m.340212 type:complete len:216 (+) Transcript_106828:54-701(+)
MERSTRSGPAGRASPSLSTGQLPGQAGGGPRRFAAVRQLLGPEAAGRPRPAADQGQERRQLRCDWPPRGCVQELGRCVQRPGGRAAGLPPRLLQRNAAGALLVRPRSEPLLRELHAPPGQRQAGKDRAEHPHEAPEEAVPVRGVPRVRAEELALRRGVVRCHKAPADAGGEVELEEAAVRHTFSTHPEPGHTARCLVQQLLHIRSHQGRSLRGHH